MSRLWQCAPCGQHLLPPMWLQAQRRAPRVSKGEADRRCGETAVFGRQPAAGKCGAEAAGRDDAFAGFAGGRSHQGSCRLPAREKRADEDLAKALRRVAELEAVVARQEADNSEGVLEKELLEEDRAKILEEANGRLLEMSRREQSLRGQCQLLKACCFRLWWCLHTELPGLEVVSPPAPQDGTQAWCGQAVDPLPVNRMPLPDDWRGILQFQAQLFHGFAEALSHRTEMATSSSPKASAASPVHSREVAMSPKSPKEEGPAEPPARHQHDGSAGHPHREVLADLRAHPVHRHGAQGPEEARKADQVRRRSPAPKAGPASAKPALRRPSSRAKLRASSADSQTGHRGGSSGKVSETSHGRRATSPQPERWKH